jgi:carboxyl-terminal processing protease
MPDVFIPLDTTTSSRFYVDLWRKGIFNDFVLSYLEKNRSKIARSFKDFEAFKTNFGIDEPLMDQFLAFAATKGVNPDDDSMEKSGNEIKYILKGMFARNLFDSNRYFEIISPIDNELMKALEVMQQETLFTRLSAIN